MTRFYLDTSVAVHALLGTSASASAWFNTTTAAPGHDLVSSRLLQIEVARMLQRERLPLSLAGAVLDHVALVPMREPILRLAESIGGPLKSLDAIHVASALVSGDVTVVTHDRQMKLAADNIALAVLDPV
jgi:uncharacterized protein